MKKHPFSLLGEHSFLYFPMLQFFLCFFLLIAVFEKKASGMSQQ